MAKKISSDNFYRAFEERYRGSRELIRSRLSVYLPFIEPLKAAYAGALAVDLGCGRGEWLELVNELGFDGTGVDLDEGMLAACHELGLKVEREEAIAYLKSLPDASVAIVSGFHIAEHIDFSELQTLVQEALRVLLPGCLLILETPNPENLVVGTASFYLDPTHQKPIPPLLLGFLPEYAGFRRSKILRLQEPQVLKKTPDISLFSVLNGVSPDYAVVAQKDGSDKLFSELSAVFSTEFGLTLETLANKFQSQVDAKIQRVEEKAQQAETKAQQAETKAQQAETKAQQAETKAQQAETKAQQAETKAQQAEAKAQQAEAKAQQAEAKAQQAEAKAQQAETKAQQAETKAQQAETKAQQAESIMNMVVNSRSWRITLPLRWCARQVRMLREHGLKSRAKAFVKKITRIAIRYISARPRLKSFAIHVARKLGIEQRLRRIYTGVDSNAQPAMVTDSGANVPVGLEHLTPRARQIYFDLKAAIELEQEESC